MTKKDNILICFFVINFIVSPNLLEHPTSEVKIIILITTLLIIMGI